MPRLFGLIGYPLSHSFSKKYFTQKFQEEGIADTSYELFPLESIEDFPRLLDDHTHLCGINVTIPYKQAVIPYLDRLEEGAAEVQAVNTIVIKNGKRIGYNTDVYGFEQSLLDFFKTNNRAIPKGALVLGTGGAAKAVHYVLKKLGIPSQRVSRHKDKGDLTYEDLTKDELNRYPLIVNTTPLGMSPHQDSCPAIPYELLDSSHLLFDLVYNPEKTVFLRTGELRNCPIQNGMEMLHLQAEKAWEIWNY